MKAYQIDRNRIKGDYSRRKAVPCGLCGTDTNDRNAICQTCRYHHAVGVTYSQEKQAALDAQDKIEIVMPVHPSAWGESECELPDEYKHRANTELVRAILAAANLEGGNRLWTRNGARRVGCRKGDQENLSLWVTDTKTADWLDRTLALVRIALARAEQRGRDAGESFVAKLASGDLSINDLTKHEIKRGGIQHGRED